MMLKLAIIILIKKRINKLKDLLHSIHNSTYHPFMLIAVDSSVPPEEDVFEQFKHLKIKYVRSSNDSIPAKRNIGIMSLPDNITHVAFLDDDIILERESLGNMMKFWEKADLNVGGASFNVVNNLHKKPNIMEKLFLVNDNKAGRILRSGFQTKLCGGIQTQWLKGGATTWRKEIFDEYKFDEHFTGYAHCEDVDFSYRVGKEYKMFVVSDAEIRHMHSLENPDFSMALGKMQIVNRIYFVKKNSEISLGLCLWACTGIFFNNILKGVFLLDMRHLKRALGNLQGLVRRENGFHC